MTDEERVAITTGRIGLALAAVELARDFIRDEAGFCALRVLDIATRQLHALSNGEESQ